MKVTKRVVQTRFLINVDEEMRKMAYRGMYAKSTRKRAVHKDYIPKTGKSRPRIKCRNTHAQDYMPRVSLNKTKKEV